MIKAKAYLLLLFGLGLLLFISACVPILSTTTELRLSTNEKWSIKIGIVLAGQDVFTKTTFEQTLQQQILAAQGYGIQASWQQITDKSNGSNLTYLIKLSGTGYTNLNQVVFNDEQAVLKGSSADQVLLNVSPLGSFFGNGQQNSFTLISGKILTSNGINTNQTTTKWTNPSSKMSATVSTKPALSLWMIFIVLGLLVVIGISIAFVRRNSARHSAFPADASNNLSYHNNQYCMSCGKKIPTASEFCPFCGQRNY